MALILKITILRIVRSTAQRILALAALGLAASLSSPGFAHLIFAVFAFAAAGGMLRGEMEKNAQKYLLTRPLARKDVILGKFAALGAANLFLSGLMMILLMGRSLLWPAYGSASPETFYLIAADSLFIPAFALALSAKTERARLGFMLWIFGVFFYATAVHFGTLNVLMKKVLAFAAGLLNPSALTLCSGIHPSVIALFYISCVLLYLAITLRWYEKVEIHGL